MTENLRARTLACALALSATVLAGAAEPTNPAQFLIRDGDRVVFYGDSITDSEWYPTLVESYVLTRFPTWRNQFSNRGVSGDNAGSIARFERDVIAQKPNFCTYNMGFNDGGYFSFSPAALEKWLGNIEKSVSLARQADPKLRMVLVSPIPNEASVSQDPRWVSRDVYPYVMLSFGAEEAKLAQRLELPFIDVGRLYGQSMGLGKVAAGDTFQLSRDGVHPQREGQTLIACHLLQGLGADPLVASVAIAAAEPKVTEARRCKVSDLTVRDGVISFRRDSESLPCPIPPEARPFAFLVRLDDTLNADTLTVSGLSAPVYTLVIDDRTIAEIAGAELAAGVNLSRYANTPMIEQALAVMAAVRAKQVLEAEYFRKWIFAGKADGAGNPTDKADTADQATMDAARKAITAAETAAYAINLPKPHTFRLAPSTAKAGRYDFLATADISQPRLELTIEPLAVDWNRQALANNEVKVKLKNPARVPRTGTLRWRGGNGWTVTPAEMAFTVEAGKEVNMSFAVQLAGGAAPAPPPELEVRWPWSDNWAYPMTISRSVQLAPKLTIGKAMAKPTLTGKLDEWKTATTFTLDHPYFIDPAVPGKKLLWGGPQDLSGKFFLSWDESALYVAALVCDDEHVQNASKMMVWSQDCLMLAFSMKETALHSARHEIIFAAYQDRNDVTETVGAGTGSGAEIAFHSQVDKANGTCLYETAIPWSRLSSFTPAPGASFRFSLCVSEADSQPGKGYNYLSWTPGISYGKSPADLATLVLGPAP